MQAVCQPALTNIGGYGMETLSGMKTAAATDPTCAWKCCYVAGFVSMDMADGLPVELMDFAIDGDDDTQGEEAASPAEDASD